MAKRRYTHHQLDGMGSGLVLLEQVILWFTCRLFGKGCPEEEDGQ